MGDYDIYVINLNRNRARWSAMQTQFVSQEIPNVIRFPAFDGRIIRDDVKSGKMPDVKLISPEAIQSARRLFRFSHEEHNFGSIGCYLSHAGCWKRILDSGKEMGVVFEDDVKIPPNFSDRLQSLLEDSPPSWEFLVFGPYSLLDGEVKEQQMRSNKFLKGRWFALNSYIIRRECCQRFVDQAYPVRIQVDWWVARRIFDESIWLLETPITSYNPGYQSDIMHTPVIGRHARVGLLGTRASLLPSRAFTEISTVDAVMSTLGVSQEVSADGKTVTRYNKGVVLAVVIVIVIIIFGVTAAILTIINLRKNKSQQ